MRARGVARSTRLPVTEENAGSNPVGPANLTVYYIYGNNWCNECKPVKN